jgi:molecular chaperone GrpE
MPQHTMSHDPEQAMPDEQWSAETMDTENMNRANSSDQEQEQSLLEQCRENICPHCEELAKVRDEKLRMAAETDNLKKRLQREKEDFCKFATESVLADLLPVLDNLDLALEHGSKSGGNSELLNGVEMTRKLFLDILQRHELEPLGQIGEDFDPNWHEALGQQPHPDMESGKVCQLVQKGYRLKGRLLRPAKVLVSA